MHAEVPMQWHMKRHILVGLTALALVACGGSESTEPADEYARASGSYTLVSLSGRPLPATLSQDASMRVDITSATLVLRADRTFTETLVGQVRQGNGQPQPERQVHNGTYTLSGTTASFAVPAAGEFPSFGFTGTLSGTVLTYTDELATYRYERR
jgi:hypothetical protein